MTKSPKLRDEPPVDLDAWAELGTKRSTSDPGKGVVHPAKRIDGYTPPVRR